MIEFGHATHAGLRRGHNEDTYWADAELGLWLVADGIAGRSLADAIRRADEAILAQSNRQAGVLPMGTTLAALRTRGDEFELAWIGDSRIYLWHRGDLERLSHDHSVVQELIEQGAISADEARTHPQRNRVTQALGITPPGELKIEPLRGRIEHGMQFLLCSDGLTEEVDDRGIAALLSRTDLAAQECVDHLILAALDAGGSDNITVVLLRVR